jgi:predicted metal-dependent hydrolase
MKNIPMTTNNISSNDPDKVFETDDSNSGSDSNQTSNANSNFFRNLAGYNDIEFFTIGVNVQRILIKSNLKSRWASLTRKGSINFNMNLIKAPQDVIDYIVLHEICHLRIRGHSHHYWDLVYRYMPNYQDKIEWLKTNGRMLIND